MKFKETERNVNAAVAAARLLNPEEFRRSNELDANFSDIANVPICSSIDGLVRILINYVTSQLLGQSVFVL